MAYFLLIRHGGLAYSDSTSYSALASRLANGSSYSIRPIEELFPWDLLRPPGYPAFLVIANGGSRISYERTAVLQVVLGALSVGALTYLVGRWLGLAVGILSGLLLALDWTTVLYTPLILADYPLSLAYGGAVACFALFLHRKRILWAVAAGLLLGVAALVKPAAEFGLLAVLLAVLVSPRANWRGGLAVLLSFLVVTVPWAVRNENAHGVFGLSTISSVNSYDFTAQVALRGSLLWTPGEALQISNAALSRLSRLHLAPPALKSRMDSDAIRIIAHHLPKALVQAALGAFRTSFGTGRDTLAESTRDGHIPSLIGTLLPLAQIVGMWLLAIIGAVGMWRRRYGSRSVTVFLVAALLFIILPSASPVANARFRIPATPMLSVLAAVGVGVLVDVIGTRRRRVGEAKAPISAA
jgi:4-amino-4-deoxy-L-arabinose transferase-like glycosyltransferase